MLAARDRAAGSSARAAMLRGDVGGAATGARPRGEPARPRRLVPPADGSCADRSVASPAPRSRADRHATARSHASAGRRARLPRPPPADAADTLARLREAKRRARGD